MKKIKFAAVLTVVMIAAVTACTPQKKKATVIPQSVATSDEALYKEGERLMKKDPEKATLYFRQIMESFPKSFYAQRAMLAIGDTYFLGGDEANMLLAAAQYRTFLGLYPTSPSAAIAQYRIAICSYDVMLKAGRDQTKTTEALAEFKKTISLYPLTEEAKLSREKIQECENRLAEHLYLIGYQYLKLKAYKAAVVRLNEILLNYPLFPEMEKVYFALGDSFLQWGKAAEAGPYFTKLVTDHATSKYGLKAQKKLKEIEEIKAKTPAPAAAPAPIKK